MQGLRCDVRNFSDGASTEVKHTGNVSVNPGQDRRSVNVVLVDLDDWQKLSNDHEVANRENLGPSTCRLHEHRPSP